MTGVDDSYRPSKDVAGIECVWCGEQTCVEKKEHGGLRKYQCMSCGESFWT